ncbi:tail fiber domain-containing protein [Neorhizobium sp. NCHU2750]|uniref:tail fiber domain-containing protein n=1 Tax=Neorhizobium sp. NCHU2750 TaxID=1825976 RepID=UPI000E736D7D|nr:hypothetical protein NCHU2750_06380 [Neorhizobium sp. NCHU2750]
MTRVPRQLAGLGASDIADATAFDVYIGPSREVTVDPTRGILALHDGSTAGGKQFSISDDLPDPVASTLLRQKSDLSGYEPITATQLQDFTTSLSFAATAGGLRQWGTRVAIGQGALAAMPQSSVGSQALVVLGMNAAPAATDANGGVVIGHDALKYAAIIPYQIVAIGHRVMRDLMASSTSLSSEPGNRNTAVGALSSVFMTTGYQNVSYGRNSGGGVSTGYQNTALGTDALGGYGPTGLSGEIQNYAPITGYQNTAVGYRAGKSQLGANENTLMGARAGSALKNGGLNTVIGSGALINGESANGITGNVIKSSTVLSSTYVVSGSTVTLTTPSAHGAAVGDTILLTYASGPCYDKTADTDVPAVVVSVPSTTTLTFAAEAAAAGSGNCTLNQVIGQTAGSTVTQATVVGRGALSAYLNGQGVVAVGYSAFNNLQTGSNGVAVGRFAGSVNVDGTNNTSYGDNVSCIGQGSRVSGTNQLQLGDTATTVYAQAAVQVRSDERDKADIRDTVLGLDFLMKLRPVDYRWDMREDYIEPFRDPPSLPDIDRPEGLESPGAEPTDKTSEAYQEWAARSATYSEDLAAYKELQSAYEAAMASYNEELAAWQTEKDAYDATWSEWFKNPTRDGSKKRERFHHGLIAQEVKAVMTDMSVDFAGLQDHSVNGGKDVLTMRYEELIPALLKGMQEQQAMIVELQAQVAAVQQGSQTPPID